MVDGMMPIPDELRGAGGTAHRPTKDIPGGRRFAVVANPRGATFILFKPNSTKIR